jgi:proteasome lid subunit RPN8/RPN11
MILPTEGYELQIIRWSNERPTEELCGVLMRHYESFMAVQIANVANEPTRTFAMDEKPFLDAVNSGQVWGTWHVHPGPNDTDGPSLADMDRANAWGLPMAILIRRTMRFRYYMPNDYKVPIFHRPYVPGIFDCFALVRQALSEYVGFELDDLDRERLDEYGCLPDIKEYWEGQGWEMLYQPKPGRVALISYFGQSRCNHLGLIISDWEMIHQLRGHPSRVDHLAGWQHWAQGYLSHPAVEHKIKTMGWTRLPFNPLDYGPSNAPAKASGRPPGSFPRPGKVNVPGRTFDPLKLRRLGP